jgi:hypothetical protein
MGLKNTSKFQNILLRRTDQVGSGCCLDSTILESRWCMDPTKDDPGKCLDPSMLGVGHVSQHTKKDY